MALPKDLGKALEKALAPLRKPRDLFEACVFLLDKHRDPKTMRIAPEAFVSIRGKLEAYAQILAPLRMEDETLWSVYVEQHIAGQVRFMLRDMFGREVDLSQLPAEPKDLPRANPEPEPVPASPSHPPVGAGRPKHTGRPGAPRDDRSGRFLGAQEQPRNVVGGIAKAPK